MATYEDREEAEFLRNVYVGRSGELENTVFAILAPDGKTLLSRAGRTPHQIWRSGGSMAEAMIKVAKKYPGEKPIQTQAALPQMKDFRLSLNVASCDGLPLVVAFGSEKKELSALRQTLVQLAFDEKLIGKYHYFATTEKDDLKPFKGFKGEPGVYLVSPGTYGTDGKISDVFKSKDELKNIKDVLSGYASILNKIEKEHHSHVQQGVRKGVNWETEIPVTDPESVRAKKDFQSRAGRK